MKWRALLLWLPLVAATTLAQTSAEAAPPEAGAAYVRGEAAFKRGEALETAGDASAAQREFAAAANEFARADELAPHPVALESALTAALRAGDVVLGLTLVDRAARDPEANALPIVSATRTQFRGRAGRITVVCPPGCRAALDGVPLDLAPRDGETATRSVWVLVGDHTVELREGSVVTSRTVRVEPGTGVRVAPRPAAAPPPVVPHRADQPGGDAAHAGLSPAWFFVGLGATAVAGSFMIASALDTRSKHEQFVSAPSTDLKEAGESAEVRTNILIGLTGALGLTTAIIGLFGVSWRARVPDNSSPSLATVVAGPMPGGAAIALRGAL
jgi:hypothetical protein